jgi:pre-60S factor REI1
MSNTFTRSTHADSNETNLDDEIEENILDTSGYSLVLPSGKVLGHRTLVRYYRQCLTDRHNNRSVALVNKLKDKYRALGWSGPGTTGSQLLVHIDVKCE